MRWKVTKHLMLLQSPTWPFRGSGCSCFLLHADLITDHLVKVFHCDLQLPLPVPCPLPHLFLLFLSLKKLLIYLLERQGVTERDFSATLITFSPQIPAVVRLGQTKASSWERHSGLPCVWLGSSCTSHQLLLPESALAGSWTEESRDSIPGAQWAC